MNGATCTYGVDSYICECDSGYTGVDCETTSKYFKEIIINKHVRIYENSILQSTEHECSMHVCRCVFVCSCLYACLSVRP